MDPLLLCAGKSVLYESAVCVCVNNNVFLSVSAHGASGLMGTSVVSVQWGKVRGRSSTSHSEKAAVRSRKRSSSQQSTGQSC